jgi:hypothetical protein
MVNTGTGDRRYHRSMSEYPPSGPSAAHGPSGYPAAPTGFPGGAAGPPVWPSPSRVPSQWPTFIALALALVASGLAIVGWFRPSPPPAAPPSKTSTYTEQQISDARTRTCAAVETTHKGVVLQSGANKQDGVSSDPALAEGQAANARLSIISGSWYLRDHLDPATPQPLADTIRHLYGVMLDIGANYLAGARDADQAQSALLSDGDSSFSRALELCK